MDVGKAALSLLDVKSAMSKQTVSLQLVPADGKLRQRTRALIDLLSVLVHSIDQAITQDLNHASMEGAVQFQGKSFLSTWRWMRKR
ncbi:hypothetical protein VQ056_00275 [Paenibacillus sp. JTLBN-2024]